MKTRFPRAIMVASALGVSLWAQAPTAAPTPAPARRGRGPVAPTGRNAKRSMVVREKIGDNCWAESEKTGYITPGLELTVKARRNPRSVSRARADAIAPKAQSLELKLGDTLILTRSLDPGHPAQYNVNNEQVAPATIGVTLAEFFDRVRQGEPIWLDDGKIGGAISAVEPGRVTVEINQAPATGAKLGAGKGINVPETDLRVASLTDDDLEALEFIAKHADILGYSFVRTEDDVRCLQERLEHLGAENLGIILKIETRQGFENLPRLLLAAMRSRAVGVMIARGDLAVECAPNRWQVSAVVATCVAAPRVCNACTAAGHTSGSMRSAFVKMVTGGEQRSRGQQND